MVNKYRVDSTGRQQKSGMHVTPRKEAKKYGYLALLMQDILTSRRECTLGLKHKESLPQDHPRRIQQQLLTNHQCIKDIFMNKNLTMILFYE